MSAPSQPVQVGTTAAFTAGVLLFLVLISPQLLNDPDTQWHVATGQWIWAHKSLPFTDPFSHTFAGSPWIAKEWLSQLILFAAHQLAGWRGVALTGAAAMAATYGILFAWLNRRVRLSVALLLSLVALMLTAPHMLARPHILVFPVIVLWVCGLVSALDARRAPPLRLALLMVLWTNMHASFPLGLALAGILGAEGVLVNPGASRLAALRRWGLFLAMAGAAAFASPYGLDAVLVPLHMKGNPGVQILTEWQPLALNASGVVALGLLLTAVAALLPNLRANIFRVVAVALLAAMMIRYSRFVDLFGFLTPILIAGSLAARWRLTPSPAVPASRPATLAAGGLAMAACATALVIDPVPSPTVTPDAAFRAAMARGVSGPVYNEYDFGGFLIAHGVKTFADGRSDQLFLGDFLPGLQRALDDKDDRAFADILKRYGVRWALVRSRSPDSSHLARLPGWTKLHEDSVAAAYAAEPSDNRLSAR